MNSQLDQIAQGFKDYEDNSVSLLGIRKRKAGKWQGKEDYKEQDMLVARHIDFSIKIPDEVEELIKITKPDLPWAESHLQERIGGQPLNPGESYKVWPYANFDKNTEFQKDEKFDHSYMERFWPKKANRKPGGQVRYTEIGTFFEGSNLPNKGIRFELGDYNDVVKQLTDNPLTRQAYLPIFFPEDTGAINDIRVPCTLGYLFEIWDNKIDITYYIRSCDMYRHFRNDIYMAGRLLQHTRMLLFLNGNSQLKVGRLYMKIANLHLFENDRYMFNKKEIKLNDTKDN